MVANRDMPTAKLPGALRDRAGKIGHQDPNTGEYLLQAARRIERLTAQIGGLQAGLRQARKDQVEPGSTPPPRDTPAPPETPEDPADWWDMDGPSPDELESEI